MAGLIYFFRDFSSHVAIFHLHVDHGFGVAETRAVFHNVFPSDYVCLGILALHDRENFRLVNMYMVAPDSLFELNELFK